MEDEQFPICGDKRAARSALKKARKNLRAHLTTLGILEKSNEQT